jgi:uncharacterized repeat protein (TIGR01451 family)
VRPGTYAVTQTQPVDWADGDSHVGTGPATVGVRGGTNSTTGIVIVSDLTGTTGIDYDFHELERVDVAVVKNVYPTRPAGGVIGVNTSFTWRLTVTNNGPSRATNVTVQDDLAAIAEQHLTVTAVTPAAGTSCSAWTATATPANLTCVVASLARGASTTIDLSVRADAVPSPATTQLVNDVRITKLDQPDTNPANDQDTDQVVVNPSDVWVTKTGSADQANVGDRITWTLQVGNKGPGTDPNVTLRDTLPARAVLVSVTPQRGTCGMNPAVANTVDCTLGAIAMGETIDIVVVAVLPEAGTYRNHVVITPGGPDTDPTNHEGSHVVRVTVPGFNECTVEGDGVITGTPGDDVICGGGGRDIITCSGGNDTILGGGGNDVIDCSAQQCGAGVPTIIGGPGNDTIRIDCPGTALSPVVICGNEGNDRIIGGRGVDIIDGGAGNDFVNGRGGNDRLYGGTGNDRLYGGTGNDQLYGGSGNDRLYGQAGNDLLYGENGNDLVVGASGFDKAHGGNGNDVFQMRDRRRDLIIGGRGRDTLFRDRRIDRWRSVERVR